MTPNHWLALTAQKNGDGILFTSLYGMTFMLGCCPILSPGVARRQGHPRRECILGNDGTNKRMLCNLLSALSVVIIWLGEIGGRYVNGASYYGNATVC